MDFHKGNKRRAEKKMEKLTDSAAPGVSIVSTDAIYVPIQSSHP